MVWGFPKPNFKPHKYWPSEVRCCNSTYRLRYWNNKTFHMLLKLTTTTLQQYLPFTVLKLPLINSKDFCPPISCNSTYRLRYWNTLNSHMEVVTIPSCCNSTYRLRYWNWKETLSCLKFHSVVATVLTVYGIETLLIPISPVTESSLLQQYLPFTVLKLLMVVAKR